MAKKRKKKATKHKIAKRHTKRKAAGKKIIFIVMDGLADLPINGKTPLSEARKPNIDFLATKGMLGELELLPKKEYPTSERANISLLGFNPNRYYVKRGPLEAVGANMPYENGHLALRCNFATVDKQMKVIDRRAGRNTYGLDEIARYINSHVKLDAGHIFMRTYEHRAALIIKEQLSDKITSNDPHSNMRYVKKIEALEPEANRAAQLVQTFVDKAHDIIEFHPSNEERIKNGILPANYIIVRGAGNILPSLPNFVNRHRVKKAVVIAENGVMKATCMLAGFNAITIPELKLESSLKFTFDAIENSLVEYNFIYAHIKWADEPAHDGNFFLKQKTIEAIDKYFEKLRDFDGIIVVTADHITACELRQHAAGNVPVLVFGKGKDKTTKFDEFAAKKGKLGVISGVRLWRFIFGK